MVDRVMGEDLYPITPSAVCLLIQALNGNLTSSLTKYHDVLKTDYDEKFGWYEDAVRE